MDFPKQFLLVFLPTSSLGDNLFVLYLPMLFNSFPFLNYLKVMYSYYTLTKMAKIKRLRIPNAGEYVEQQELLSIAGGNSKLHSSSGKQLGNFI